MFLKLWPSSLTLQSWSLDNISSLAPFMWCIIFTFRFTFFLRINLGSWKNGFLLYFILLSLVWIVREMFFLRTQVYPDWLLTSQEGVQVLSSYMVVLQLLADWLGVGQKWIWEGNKNVILCHFSHSLHHCVMSVTLGPDSYQTVFEKTTKMFYILCSSKCIRYLHNKL